MSGKALRFGDPVTRIEGVGQMIEATEHSLGNKASARDPGQYSTVLLSLWRRAAH